MAKSIVITLNADPAFPDTDLTAPASVVVNGVTYAGKVTGVIIHEDAVEVPPTQTVTLKATGLSVA